LTLSTASPAPDSNINLTISSAPFSTILLIANDKSFMSFRPGSDIKKSDIHEAYSALRRHKSEPHGSVILFDNLTSWRICSDEELDDLKRQVDVIEEPSSAESHQDPLDIEVDPENYEMDTWIFETISLPSSGSISIPLTVPSTITTWTLSAISMNSEHGLAVSDPQDLVVVREFFIKLNLPYSIFNGEVFQLDVFVFNNLAASESMSAKVTLYRENFDFVEYKKAQSDCQMSVVDAPKKTISIEVNAGTGMGSFYIRSTNPGLIKLRLSAMALTPSNREFKNEIVEKLLVETEGATLEDTAITIVNFDSHLKEHYSYGFSSMNVNKDFIKFSAKISSDLMENSISYDTQSM
jgi:Alpha-2-macroglobulin family